ncbi:hypothetical protein EMIT0P176_380005 [Pseudomonas sp. IT-P176]
MDQDQKQEHGDLAVGLSGKSGRGGLPADLFALVSRSLVGAGPRWRSAPHRISRQYPNPL